MKREAENRPRGEDPLQEVGGAHPAGEACGEGLGAGEGPGWGFLSHHAHVLICLVREPDLRLRDVAHRVQITERSVHRILTDLEREGLIERQRVGRRNTYLLELDRPLRHPLERHRTVQDLVGLLVD